MILDEFVDVKWHASNKKYLTNLGYVYTGIGSIVTIKTHDLKKGSHHRLHVKCDVCGNEKILAYKVYNKNIKSGGYYGCSDKCSIEKYNNTNLLLYGVKCPSLSNEIKEKTKLSCLKKYGVNCTLHAESIKLKVIKTTIKNFGTSHHTQSSKFQEASKKISLEKYGVDSYLKTDKFKAQTKISNMKKFGTENPNELDEIKEKTKQTNLRKYGVEYTSQSLIVREKIKQTNLKRYGVEYLHQNKIIAKKAQNTMIEKYGEIWLKHTPSYNANSITYLDMISEKLGIPIQHALNGGEKKFMRYWVDGYIEQYNIVLEWDEKFHNVKKFKTKDAIKETFLKENFNCYIIRINEKEFLSDIDNQINILCDKINTFINQITKTA